MRVKNVAKRRPNFNHAIRALLRDIVGRTPKFQHVRPSRVLVVAGEARRTSRGTVRPLTFAGGKSVDPRGRRKPVVRYRKKRMLYLITLRPLFFRASTPDQRIRTVLHELFHISSRFDGTLHQGRRHSRLGKAFAARLQPIVRRYLRQCPPEIRAPFAYDGEVRMLQWLERPGTGYESGKSRRVYTEEQLFFGTVRMITKRAKVAKPAKPRIKLQ
jgi:putative metallopeptidase